MNETIVYPVNYPGPVDLLIRRDRLHERISLYRDAVQANGMKYTFPDGKVGTVQTRNEKDLLNVSGQAVAALILQMEGRKDPCMQFRDTENVVHAMTPQQMLAMGIAVSNFINATYNSKWKHDDQVDIWHGDVEYDYTTGWPS
jgi:hypothetical protein